MQTYDSYGMITIFNEGAQLYQCSEYPYYTIFPEVLSLQ